MKDRNSANMLQQPLEQALKTGDQTNPDIMLAQVTYQMAKWWVNPNLIKSDYYV